MIQRLFVRVALAATLVSVGACAATSADEDEGMGTWEDALGFDKDSVLSDAEFTDTSALSAAQIQTFLENTHCNKRSSLADYVDPTSGKTAAQMLSEAATKYRINPIEFLVRLQVERSMLCKPADTYAIEHALSCGCPDGAPCKAIYAGFDRQVQCAATHFRKYLDDIASKGYTIAGWAPHKTKNSSDPLAVTPANAATAALYTYTPWVYNGGNQLHYQVWNAITKALKYKPSGTTPETKSPTAVQPPASGAGEVPRGCTSDTECNHGALGTGRVCANAGPERGTCFDGCHQDTDCPTGGKCDQTATPHWQCTNQPPATGTKCTTDAECTSGGAGAGRVCSTESHTCIVGCHSDDDCGASGGATGKKGVCDRGLKTWQCVYRKEIGDPCADDKECNGGVGGTTRICLDAAPRTCIDGCRVDADCDERSTCEWPGGEPYGICLDDPTKANSAPVRAPNGCPALVFPSGVKIQTVRDAVLEAAYKNHTEPGKVAPKCFIDVDNLVNPDLGVKLDYSTVRLSEHFTLRELVGTEVAQGWGRRVLLDPSAVDSLEDFRRSEGYPFSPNSGYRSPLHQEAICKSLCGAAWCPGKCARYSRHMWGDAFDLPKKFYSYKYAQLACDAGFKFAYNENRTHLHVDMSPRSSTCVIQFD